MTTYRKIHGRSIQAVTTDPTETVSEGQVWYNTTSDTFKTTLVSEAWVSGTVLPSVRYRHTAFGTATAGVITGGSVNTPGAQPSTTTSFEYNGSGFSSGGALNTARRGLASAGVITAGLVFGGSGGSSDANVNN